MGAGASVKKPLPVEVKTWVNVNDSDFVYPELREAYADASGPSIKKMLEEKDDLGLCFSGGGFRACSQTIGWLRALNKLGILQKARYISTVSGASWAVAPMATFSSAGEIEKYLGKYVPPEECSVNALKKVDGLLQVMVKANCVQKFVEKMFTTFDNDERDFWSTAVGDIFFQDYKVNNPRTIPVIGNHQSAANKKAFNANKKLGNHLRTVDVSTNLHFLPYSIVNASAMIGGEYKFAPLEFTPLYYGIPTSLDIELAGEDSVADKFDGKYELGPNKVGGLVEPIGFGLNLKEYLETKKGSDAAKHPNKGLQEVYSEVDPTTRKLVLDATPDRIISISEQSGLSSTYISLLLSDAVSYPLFKLLNNPVLPYWSPESGFNTNGLGVVDGGANSLTGLPSVLRRGVKKAMVFYSPNCAMDTEGAAQAKVSGLAHIAGYFGRMEDPKNENISGGVTEAAFNKMHQVFPSDRWDEFLDKGLKCFQAGEPIVVPMTIPVLANPLINVKGGYDLKIIFVSMDEDRKWFEKIPHDLQERFKKDNAHEKTTAENVKEMAGIKEVDLENFPFVSVKKFDYSPILANSLSQLATWEIMHTGPVINEFFGY